jgi:hypothetical protein
VDTVVDFRVVKVCECFKQLSDCQLLKEDHVSWGQRAEILGVMEYVTPGTLPGISCPHRAYWL